MSDGSQRSIVAVTGATGFIGRHLCRHLAHAGFDVRALTRVMPEHAPEHVQYLPLGDLEVVSGEALVKALDGVSSIVHLAGRAHVMQERARDPADAYRLANVEAATRVVAAAIRANVSRWVLASTVKVNGESTPPGRPFRPDDAPAPQDDYARSKAEAERVVLGAVERASMLPVILRLPLVYGPGVGGNFARLIDAVASRRALPIGAIDNRRSIAYVGNVCSAMEAVLVAGSQVRGVHFVADDEPVSTPQLARAIGEAMGMPARIAAVPLPVLRSIAWITGRRAEMERLAGTLEVDTASLRTSAQWRPSHTLAQGLADTATWWRAHHSI